MGKEFDNIHLSEESLTLLMHFAQMEEIPSDQYSGNPCFDQLYQYGLIETHIIDYENMDSPRLENIKAVFSPYRITEFGKGYLRTLRHDNEFKESIRAMSDSAKEIANSAKQQADSAEDIAKSAKQQADTAKDIAKSAKQQANAATKQADIAFKVAKKADIKGWIASIAAAILTIIEAIDHLDVILSLFQGFIH